MELKEKTFDELINEKEKNLRELTDKLKEIKIYLKNNKSEYYVRLMYLSSDSEYSSFLNEYNRLIQERMELKFETVPDNEEERKYYMEQMQDYEKSLEELSLKLKTLQNDNLDFISEYCRNENQMLDYKKQIKEEKKYLKKYQKGKKVTK